MLLQSMFSLWSCINVCPWKAAFSSKLRLLPGAEKSNLPWPQWVCLAKIPENIWRLSLGNEGLGGRASFGSYLHMTLLFCDYVLPHLLLVRILSCIKINITSFTQGISLLMALPLNYHPWWKHCKLPFSTASGSCCKVTIIPVLLPYMPSKYYPGTFFPYGKP